MLLCRCVVEAVLDPVADPEILEQGREKWRVEHFPSLCTPRAYREGMQWQNKLFLVTLSLGKF